MADDFFGRDEYDLFNRNVAGYLNFEKVWKKNCEIEVFNKKKG